MQTPAIALRWLPLLLVLAALLPGAGSAQALKGDVLSIGDGDTIRVRQGGRAITVRLACIDAPETAQSPWGQQARRYLQQSLPIGREVSLEVKATDRYGRTVAEVIRDINLNLAMVEDGQAFAYRPYLGGCDAKEYLDAEYRASRSRYGVWQVEGGITRPWDFRRGRGTTVITDGTTPGGRRYRCSEISSYDRAQELLRQGHTYLDGNGDGQACESLR
ncbi:thermonuclease family protein [Synechococcus sp. BA-132 BA5]|uniref:thermonuclease family protein n=1 Tax=Synechococcus sp. BA-132 BA5 TaxID=3110252 RepID=UPI002B207AB8|nr:thermonuclease family protein [Synechococcus sp. BA-132 BA5]MEA5416473.1 thermonuclease family protein [Synechococcus sp. BA-132 BA5]